MPRRKADETHGSFHLTRRKEVYFIPVPSGRPNGRSRSRNRKSSLDGGWTIYVWLLPRRFVSCSLLVRLYLQVIVVTKKLCPIEVEYKLVQNNKNEMAKLAKDNAKSTHFYPEEQGQEEHPVGLWSNNDSDASSSDGWTKFDQPIIYL